MHISSNQVNLPLFMLSRNRIKADHVDQVRKIIQKQPPIIKCEFGKDQFSVEKAARNKFKTNNSITQPPCTNRVIFNPLKTTRNTGHVAPNHYNTQKKPFEDKMGAYGAYWKKLSTHKSLKRPDTQKPISQRHLNVEHRNRCSSRKGEFLSNARERRAVIRSMINDLTACVRNPKDPGPSHYFPQNFTISHNASPKVKVKRPQPYSFLYQSSVPAKPNSIHPRVRLGPGPTSYENRITRVSASYWSRLIYQPGLQLLLDEQKRRRFRRQPYKDIKPQQYFSPDWHHVAGRGFTRLFNQTRNRSRMSDISEEIQDQKDITHLPPHLKLYADHRYINMINKPRRHPISFRKKGSYIQKPPSIKFTFMDNKLFIMHYRSKVSRKKIAFNTTKNRFDYAEKPIPLTRKQIWKIKQSLPLELRMRNYPIMTKQPDEIHAKLEIAPKRYVPPENVVVEKRLFKFPPIHVGKLLVAPHEVQTTNTNVFYDKKLDPTLFFKDPSIIHTYGWNFK